MADDPRDDFLAQLRASVHDGTLIKLTLGKSRSEDPSLRQLLVRPVQLRGQPHLSMVWRYEQRDVTKNHALGEGLGMLAPLIGREFYSAHLFTPSRLAQLEFNKKGTARLSYGPATETTADSTHDRTKQRLLPEQSQAWLHALGVTTVNGSVREGMADKHRQIHKFVEILSHLAANTNLPTHRPIELADMGCGKGYLTFAAYDYFKLVAARAIHVRGIEARDELVQFCNRIAHETNREQLEFIPGTITSVELPALDVLIALHACDTATDDALAKGVQAGAGLIVVSPCCQKELRSQLRAAPVLAPALRHGIFQERQAEFVTDALRALLLEWAGYDTKVFEFISTEHTAKNLMITATKREGPARTETAATPVRELAAFYGIKTHALARHFYFDLGS